MHQLPDPAINAILKEWHPKEYDPPNTDIGEWNRTIETLSDTYGIPDNQRAHCAVKFIRSDLRTELENVLKDARSQFGPVHWARFTTFMVEFDRNFRESWENLPFYRKHPKRIGAALGVAGGIMLAPLAVGTVLTAVGFTSAGVAAGSLAATIQSIVYGGATGGLFSLLQSAGATMVLPSVGTILTGAATTGAGIAVMQSDESDNSEIILKDTRTRVHRPGDTDGGDDNDSPPPYGQAVPREYLLTPPAVEAIVKSWGIAPYNPPGTDAAGWLSRVQKLCDDYGVPLTQRALCAMRHMRADCRDEAHAAGCYDMMWDQFTAWLLTYDDERKTSLNRKMAEMMTKGPKNLKTPPHQ